MLNININLNMEHINVEYINMESLYYGFGGGYIGFNLTIFIFQWSNS